jgi:hypothetical protein
MQKNANNIQTPKESITDGSLDSVHPWQSQMVLWCYRIANLYGLQKETLQRRRMGIS